jgi:thiopeptide-type bacteriocin biosynthesis protein
MSVYVFLGPTLPAAEAREILDAVYLPPVEQGDILRLLREKPDAIGIVDGRFQFIPSVWHKEILAALAQGVHVFGASSMGALRAAELWQFGMTGIGGIFERYRDGSLEDDDEVAVVHASADHGFRETSDAMVNIRDACEAASREGAIAPETRASLIAIAKSLYFPERSWARVFELAREAGIADSEIAAMNSFRRTHVPLKRRDARAMLRHMAEFLRQTRQPFQPSFELERTVFLEHLELEAAAGRIAESFEAPADGLEVARKKVLLELLSVEEARRLGRQASDADVREMASWFRGAFNLKPDLDHWKRQAGIDDETLAEMMRRFASVNRVQQHYAQAIERALPAHLAVTTARGRQAGWSQWNVALSRSRGPARQSAAELFARLGPVLAGLRQQGALRRFYFMRKPPDVRLRFEGDAGFIDAALRELWPQLEREGWIERRFLSVYEPETGRFGGPRAMDLAHSWFDADARVWMDWPDVPRSYSAALLQDLFVSTVNDLDEAAQVWREFAGVEPHGHPAPEVWTRPLDEKHEQANRAFASGLTAVWSEGSLETGVRSVLAAMTQFHCNRYGIAGDGQAALASAALAAYTPARYWRLGA